MSSNIFTPSNRVKLTNVAVVRLKKGGKRFELACFKNKIADYRAKVTRRIDDVLQISSIFANVSKGELAKQEDLHAAFGANTKPEEIIMQILEKGEVQLSSKEADQQSEAKFKEIALVVAEKCLNPTTNTPYPQNIIERAMRELGVTVHATKTAKQQALEVITTLVKSRKFPIVRARMRVIIDAPLASAADVSEISKVLCSEIETDKRCIEEGVIQITALVEPGNFRQLSEQIGSKTHGKGAVHPISLKE